MSQLPLATRVLESRRAPDGAAVRRRRECSRCGHRFTTFERREPEPRYVIKRDGERQRFDRTKLRAALLGAAHKRPVDRLRHRGDRRPGRAGGRATEAGELSSERIGELCLDGAARARLGRLSAVRRNAAVDLGPTGLRNAAMVEGRFRPRRARGCWSPPQKPLRGEDLMSKTAAKDAQTRTSGLSGRTPLHDRRRPPLRRGRVGASRRGDRRSREPGVRAAGGRVPGRAGPRTRPTSSPRSTSAASSDRRSASAP